MITAKDAVFVSGSTKAIKMVLRGDVIMPKIEVMDGNKAAAVDSPFKARRYSGLSHYPADTPR